MLKKMMLGAAAALLLALPTLAQQIPPATRLAFVQNKALYTLEPTSTTPVLVDSAPTYDYSAVWSPDSTKLAYVASADGQEFSEMKTLKVWDGTQALDIVTNFKSASGMPINWTSDGKIVYFVATPEFIDAGQRMEVYIVDAAAGAAPELVSNQVTIGAGCGGSSSIPMDWATWVENGFGGRPLIQLTDYGLVYPSICAGGRGALFRTFSNELTPFADGKLSDMALSADQRSLAGLVGDDAGNTSLVVVNLETMEEKTIPTQRSPLQVVWGADGSLYYASSTEAGNLLTGLTDEQLRTFSTALGIPADVPVETKLARNSLSISRIAADGTESLVAEGGDAYTIGRMQVVGNTLYVSTISNGADWVKAVLDGTLTPDNNFDKAGETVHTTIYSIDLATPNSVPVIVLNDATQFAAAGA